MQKSPVLPVRRRAAIVLSLGLLAASVTLGVSGRATGRSTALDLRQEKLHRYFSLQRSPLTAYAAEFVTVADRQALDWRLLPSIAMVESSGGKHYRNNNIFGWANGQAKFQSVAHGIRVVGDRLARGRSYRAKSTAQKLHTYNPKAKYVRTVLALMDRIGAPDSGSGRSRGDAN